MTFLLSQIVPMKILPDIRMGQRSMLLA